MAQAAAPQRGGARVSGASAGDGGRHQRLRAQHQPTTARQGARDAATAARPWRGACSLPQSSCDALRWTEDKRAGGRVPATQRGLLANGGVGAPEPGCQL